MMYFTELPLVQAIGWALLHAVWQGLLIAIVLRLLLLLIPNRRAVLRYGLSVGAIFLMLLWAAVTCWQHLPDEGSLLSAEITPLAIDVIPDSTEVLYPSEESTVETSALSLTDVSKTLQPLLPYFVGLWLIGVMLWSIRFMGSMLYLYRLPRQHVRQPDATWQRKLRSLQKQLALSKRVRLLISAKIQEPLTMGFLKPVILIPASLLSNLPPEQIEAILLHELAHIQRADYLINLLLSIVEILFFYHPAYWWISRQVKQEREHCCDDQVLKRSGDHVTYAQALIAVQRLSLTHQNHLVMNFSGNKSQFSFRIHRLFGQSHQNRMVPGLSGLGMLTFCLFLFIFTAVHKDLQAQNQNIKAKFEVVTGEKTSSVLVEGYNLFKIGEPIKLTVTAEKIHITIDLLEATHEDFNKLTKELRELGVEFELGKSIPEPDWYEMKIAYKEKKSRSLFRNAGLVDLSIARNPEEGKTSIGYSLGPIPQHLRKAGQESVEIRIPDLPKMKPEQGFDTETVSEISAESQNEFIHEEIDPSENNLPEEQKTLMELAPVVEGKRREPKVETVESIPKADLEKVYKENLDAIKIDFDTMAWITLDKDGNENHNQFIMGPSMEISVKDKAKTPKVFLTQNGIKTTISWEQFKELNQLISPKDIQTIEVITGKAAEKRYGESDLAIELTLVQGVTFPSKKVKTISVDSRISNLTVFPNPTQGQLNIDFEVKQAGEIAIQILNLKGQVIDEVYQGNVEATRQRFSYTDKANRLSNGVYLIQLKMGDAVTTQKFVLER